MASGTRRPRFVEPPLILAQRGRRGPAGGQRFPGMESTCRGPPPPVRVPRLPAAGTPRAAAQTCARPRGGNGRSPCAVIRASRCPTIGGRAHAPALPHERSVVRSGSGGADRRYDLPCPCVTGVVSYPATATIATPTRPDPTSSTARRSRGGARAARLRRRTSHRARWTRSTRRGRTPAGYARSPRLVRRDRPRIGGHERHRRHDARRTR